MAPETGKPDEQPIPVLRRSGSEPPALQTTSPTTLNDKSTDESETSPIDLSDAPETIYSSKSEICDPIELVKNIFRDMLNGRELAWRLFVRNIHGLYRQTFFGLFWAFLPPLANTAFWIFLSNANVFSTKEIPVDPRVYILASMIFWQAFIDAFQMPLNMLNKNKNMISKLNFPRESLLMVGIGEVIFDLLIRMLLLIPAFIMFGVGLSPSILLVPLVVLALILVGAGLGLLLLPIGSLYQDVGRFIGIALPFWMILTPVIYPPATSFPLSLLNWLNPASPLLIVARDWTLMGTTSFGTAGWIYGLAALPLFLVGVIVFRISIPVLVERMNA